jgi:predicted metal-dependent HD superfamily phosphohydrolase
VINKWRLKRANSPSLPPPMTDTYPIGLDDNALAATWDAAWSLIGRPPLVGLQAELMSAWSEPQRHYHDQRHLRECLALWLRWRDHCECPGEVAIALWFHDAVYDPQALQAGLNELQSATWAARALTQAGVSTKTAQRVHDLVMATQHDAPTVLAASTDAQLLLDIDLSILGSPAKRFAAYDQDVRKEYAWVPTERYRQARAKVLQGFLDRSRLYCGQQATQLLEGQAHVNLRFALTRLAQ